MLNQNDPKKRSTIHKANKPSEQTFAERRPYEGAFKLKTVYRKPISAIETFTNQVEAYFGRPSIKVHVS